MSAVFLAVLYIMAMTVLRGKALFCLSQRKFGIQFNARPPATAAAAHSDCDASSHAAADAHYYAGHRQSRAANS
jgi:hypothetical protein